MSGLLVDDCHIGGLFVFHLDALDLAPQAL